MNHTPAALERWDCHAHVFGPYDRYPLAAERSYTPPPATQTDYLAMLARLGMTRGVLVHPSAYGSDHSLLLDTLQACPQLRGVVVVQSADQLPLKTLREQGVRAARFSCRSGAGKNFAGSASWDDLLQLAPALADAGLHAELWTDGQMLPEIAPRLKSLPIPVVIDHMGSIDVTQGPTSAGFNALCDLLAGGHVWVKLCAYRNLLNQPDWSVGRAFHERLVQANPTQLVWGSDWPHLNIATPPATDALLQLFTDWTASPGLTEQILGSNPARLYE
jgi:predicted TIM-barrel fold metal-dependent hydrolase